MRYAQQRRQKPPSAASESEGLGLDAEAEAAETSSVAQKTPGAEPHYPVSNDANGSMFHMLRLRKIVAMPAAALLLASFVGCSSASLRIVTSGHAAPSGMEALLVARLEASDGGCVYAQSGDELVTLIWPKGYTVSGDSDSFTVQDADAAVVTQSGIDLDIAGGRVDSLDDGGSDNGCATDALWLVGEIASSAGAP